jgi:hypothetical protein
MNQGENFAVQHDGYTGNIMDGGVVRVAGQGESQVIAYSDLSRVRLVAENAKEVSQPDTAHLTPHPWL